MMFRIGRYSLVALALFFPATAWAQDLPVPDIDGYDKILGAVVIALPDYEGSDDYTAAVAPVGKWDFQGDRYVQLLGNKVYVNLIDDKNWELGPMGVYRFGRDDVDDSAVDAMSDVDDSGELGIFGGYNLKFDNDIRHRMNVNIQVSQDVTDGHDGFVAQVGGTYWRPVAKPFDLGFKASTSYASDDYMSSFFDVSTADAGASGLSVYDADAGFKDVTVGLMGLFHINETWHVGGGLYYSRLLGDAADSPVVDDQGDPNQFFAGLSLVVTW